MPGDVFKLVAQVGRAAAHNRDAVGDGRGVVAVAPVAGDVVARPRENLCGLVVGTGWSGGRRRVVPAYDGYSRQRAGRPPLEARPGGVARQAGAEVHDWDAFGAEGGRDVGIEVGHARCSPARSARGTLWLLSRVREVFYGIAVQNLEDAREAAGTPVHGVLVPHIAQPLRVFKQVPRERTLHIGHDFRVAPLTRRLPRLTPVSLRRRHLRAA